MLTTLYRMISKFLSRLSGSEHLEPSPLPSDSLPDSQDSEKPTSEPKTVSVTNVRWGSDEQITPELLNSVAWTCQQLMPQRDLSEFMSELLSCMAFETGYTFSPRAKNPYSGATGLIQFMPNTAQGLGTNVKALAEMSPVEQMNYVYKYFKPYKGRLANLGDVYLAIFYPAAMNKPDSWVIAYKGSKVYEQNAGFDREKKGHITRGDTLRAVREAHQRGLAKTFTGEVWL